MSESSPPITLSIKLSADQKIAGIIHCGPDRDEKDKTCEITGLYLHPHFWGMGGGTLLLQGALKLQKWPNTKEFVLGH